MASSKAWAIVAGVGPGTCVLTLVNAELCTPSPGLTRLTCRGTAVARKFASKYSVALLARNPAHYEPLVQEIEASGGKAVGFSADVADSASVWNAFEKIKAEMKGAQLAAA